MNLPPQKTINRQDVLRAIVSAVKQQGLGATDVFGLRLMRKSFDFLMSQLDILYPELLSDTARLQATFGSTLYIHLTRKDKIAQAISLVKATQTGLWHRALDGTELERNAPPQPPFYDAKQIASCVDELTMYDKNWERWFEQEQIEPVRVNYEDLAANPIDTLAGILDALGLSTDAVTGVVPSVAKLADDTNNIWACRYRAELGSYKPNTALANSSNV